MKAAIIILVVLVSIEASSQTKHRVKPPISNSLVAPAVPRTEQVNSEITDLFKRVERSIAAGSVEPLVREFNATIYMSLGSKEMGYYSANQASTILAAYFAQRRPVSFAFSSIDQRERSPFATGRLMTVSKGTQELTQVYVSLTRIESKWVINQFNIY